MLFKEDNRCALCIRTGKFVLNSRLHGVDAIPIYFFHEASPCLYNEVYEVLIIFCWLPQRVVHPNSAFIDLDNKKDLVEAVSYTYM